MTTKLSCKGLSQSIQRFHIDDIEKSIVKYTIETINPNHTDLSLFASNHNEDIVNILRDNKTPICFDVFNALFENLLDQERKTKFWYDFYSKIYCRFYL